MSKALSFTSSRLLAMRIQLYAQGDITPELLAYQRLLKIGHSVLTANAGILAVCLAKFYRSSDGDERFEFAPDGVPSAVIEAPLYDLNREEYVADLVSWPLDDRWGFATALGINGGADVLGAIHMVQRGGQPLRVFQTPHDWLAAGCGGCVPISEKWGGYWLHKAGGPFAVSSLEEGRWLRNLLQPFGMHKDILVPLSSEKEAA